MMLMGMQRMPLAQPPAWPCMRLPLGVSVTAERWKGAWLLCQEAEPRLPTLLKLLLWAQNQLDNKLQYPRMVDLVAGRLSDPADVNQMC